MDIKDLRIESTAFASRAAIPARHTADGEDVSPELRWTGLPEGTRQLALVVHDPDAPLPRGFTHWVCAGIPPEADGIAEGDGARFTEGRNGAGDTGYMGPAPPEGHGPHHYFFWLYALDTAVDVQPGMTREQLLDRIEDHVIEQARLVGTYER